MFKSGEGSKRGFHRNWFEGVCRVELVQSRSLVRSDMVPEDGGLLGPGSTSMIRLICVLYLLRIHVVG